MSRLLRCGAVGLVFALVPMWPAGGWAAPAAVLAPIAPPSGVEGFGASWYTVPAADGRTMVLAVYDPRPTLDEARPAILVLHGSHGFATAYLQIAHDLAEQTGYVVAAGCWFDGIGPDADASNVTSIQCPGAPAYAGANGGSWQAVWTLAQAVHVYAGGAGLGLFGHERGATVALQLASMPEFDDLTIGGVIASSGVYTALPQATLPDAPTPLALVESLSAPVLILHGQADTQARFSNAALYYQRLQSLGKPAQCVVYPRAGHDAILQTAPGDPQHRVFTDGVRRSTAFFRGVFSPGASVLSTDCAPG